MTRREQAWQTWWEENDGLVLFNALEEKQQAEIFGKFLSDDTALSLGDFSNNPMNLSDAEVGQVVKKKFKLYISAYDFSDLDCDSFDEEAWNPNGFGDEEVEADEQPTEPKGE